MASDQAIDQPVIDEPVIDEPEESVVSPTVKAAAKKAVVPEVTDTRDVSPRAPKADTKGERVRAIPAKGGTTVEVTRADFKKHGIDNPNVVWDFRKDNFTVKVGPVLSKAAADFLCENFPTSFEYMGH